MQVYIHREKNVLIEVSFHIRIPRTFKHFAGFMVCAHAHHARVHPCDVFRADVRVRVRVVLMHVRMRVWAGTASAYVAESIKIPDFGGVHLVRVRPWRAFSLMRAI